MCRQFPMIPAKVHAGKKSMSGSRSDFLYMCNEQRMKEERIQSITNRIRLKF